MSSEVGNVTAMSTAQVAESLGVNVATVHRMVQRGELVPALKMPGLRGPYLFEAATVDALVAKREGARP